MILGLYPLTYYLLFPTHLLTSCQVDNPNKLTIFKRLLKFVTYFFTLSHSPLTLVVMYDQSRHHRLIVTLYVIELFSCKQQKPTLASFCKMGNCWQNMSWVVQPIESLAEKGQEPGQLGLSRYVIDCLIWKLFRMDQSQPYCFLSLHCSAQGLKS